MGYDMGGYYGPYGYGTPPPWRENVSVSIKVYPCDRGTGKPIGYHEFAASDSGVVVCRYCGQRPKN